MSSETSDKSVRELLAADDSPFNTCDECGTVYVSGGHECNTSKVFDRSMSSAMRDVVKEYDQNPPDEEVAYCPHHRAFAYHKRVEDGDGVIETCSQAGKDIDWSYDERAFVQHRYDRYPCPECFDLPADEIQERFDQL